MLSLGRPFFTNGGALINAAVGSLILLLIDEYIAFNIYKMIKYPKSTFFHVFSSQFI